MSDALDIDHHVELRLAGRDEFWRPVFIITAVCGGCSMVVWDGLDYDDARAAARFWEQDGIEVVDLVAKETRQ